MDARGGRRPAGPTFRAQLRAAARAGPPGLRPAQIDAIHGLERSLAEDRPRALIQMATGAGKTFTAVTETYRLLKHARAGGSCSWSTATTSATRRCSEFAGLHDPRRRPQVHRPLQRRPAAGSGMLDSSKVVISTIQRM